MFFLVAGFSFLEFAKIFEQGYELQEPIPTSNFVSFSDYPNNEWLSDVEITTTDFKPLEIHTGLRFHAFVTTKILPEELVMHIFHEDMSDFFLGQGSSDYQQISNQLGKVPTLRFGDVFNIKFDMFENSEKLQSFGYNEFEQVSFKKAGNYFTLVSIKTTDGKILHYKGSTSVMQIRDPVEGYIVRSLDKLLGSAEEQKVANFNNTGLPYIGIGIGMLITGIDLILVSVEKKEKKPFYR